ncbi:hypothetical protein Tco_0502689 [Tanacetum coccineum]
MDEGEVVATEKTLMLLKYLEHQMRLLEEVEEVAMKVETQKEFLVRHVSVFSFYELPPDQLDVDLNNLTLMNFAEPHTSHCGGGRRVVIVVVIVEIVAIDVRRGELDCDFVRSITRVVIGGTEEVS